LLPQKQQIGSFVHLAYVDDSGSDGKTPIVIIGGIVIPGDLFWNLESAVFNAVANTVPQDRLGEFNEFHAAELYYGHGVFKDTDADTRVGAIQGMLSSLVRFSRLKFIYAAVDKAALARSPFGSANPLDIAFRVCLLGIEAHAQQQHEAPIPPSDVVIDPKDLCLVVVDNMDKAVRDQLKASFRQLRRRRHPPCEDWTENNRLWHIHDELYFGDSSDSAGLQLADLCCWVIQQHLRKRIPDDLFKMIKTRIECAKPDPEWADYSGVLISHDAPNAC
jgi:hypothetical protein